MVDARFPVARRLVAAALLLALTLAGVGRASATASDGPMFGVPGVAAQICHAGPSGGSAPADRSHHDCCDDCALGLFTVGPMGLSVAGFVAVERAIIRGSAPGWAPALARTRGPRQSQGPPGRVT